MSKVILYMTTSADGFIASTNDETPWSDASWDSFRDFVKSCDCVLLGRRTYKIMKAGDEFAEGPEYIVVTNNASFDTGSVPKLSIKSLGDMPQDNKVGVIGGGELNGSLAKLSAIDEVILDIEPITLGQGKQLFGSHDVNLKLKLLGTKQYGGSTVQNHYEVVR